MEEIIKTFTNTDSEDFEGMIHSDKYFIKAGESKQFTEKTAKHLARQLAYKIGLRNAKTDLNPEKQVAIASSLVGETNLPPIAVKVEEPKAVVEEPKEEEFADIKPKKKAKAKKK